LQYGILREKERVFVNLAMGKGNASSVMDALNLSTSFAYDVMGRVTSQTLCLMVGSWVEVTKKKGSIHYLWVNECLYPIEEW